MFKIFPTFIANLCHRDAFEGWIRVAMSSLNMGINNGSKQSDITAV